MTHWSDLHLKTGDLWRQGMDQALARAKVTPLLVGADLLNSKFSDEGELPNLLHTAEEQGLRIQLVHSRPGYGKQHGQISKTEAGP